MQAKRICHTALVTVAVIAVATFVLQIFAGDFPVRFFEFPMNVVVAALWLLILAELFRRRNESPVARFMLSMEATYMSLFFAAIGGIAVGVMSDVPTRTWPFVAMMLFVMSHLVMITLRGWRNGEGVRWRFLLNHTGLLLALGAGFWGAPDVEELRLPLVEGHSTSEAYVRDGRSVPLGYEVELLDFDIAYFDNGVPSDYSARTKIAGEEVVLRVNTPYRYRLGEDIYLVSHEKDLVGRSRCIVQVVREAWSPLMVAGVVMLLAGAMLMFLQGVRKGVIR